MVVRRHPSERSNFSRCRRSRRSARVPLPLSAVGPVRSFALRGRRWVLVWVGISDSQRGLQRESRRNVAGPWGRAVSGLGQYSGWIVAALLGVIAVLVAVLNRKPLVVSPEVSPLQKQKDEEIKKVEQDAANAKSEEQKQAHEQHDSQMAVVINAETKQVQDVQDDPDAVNKVLQDVGGKVR